jgi:plasmid stabilization system protein ParE
VKAVFSQAALDDLDHILAYTATHYPSLEAKLEQRVRAAIARIELLPEHAHLLEGSENVRVVPLLRYPFKIFYQADGDRILILHIHHTARQSG